MPLQELNEPQKEKKKKRIFLLKWQAAGLAWIDGEKSVEYTLTALFLSRPGRE